MHPDYQSTLIDEAVRATVARALDGGWDDVRVERDGTAVFITLEGAERGDDYLAKIEMGRYPLEPYEIGFVKPGSSGAERFRVSDRDPRYWPWSPMPALHGNFNLHFPGAIRVFWCRDCTTAYFYYHGHEAGQQWRPAAWPLWRVVSHLREAVKRAVHPARWRPHQRPRIGQYAARLGQRLPDGGGIGDA